RPKQESPASPQRPLQTKKEKRPLPSKDPEKSQEVEPVDEGQKIHDRLIKSTVWIVNKGATGMSSGSGSLVDQKNELILTNYHVPRGSEESRLLVFFPEYNGGALIDDKRHYMEKAFRGGGTPASLLYEDKARDLAIIQVRSLPEGVQQLRLSRTGAKSGQ